MGYKPTKNELEDLEELKGSVEAVMDGVAHFKGITQAVESLVIDAIRIDDDMDYEFTFRIGFKDPRIKDKIFYQEITVCMPAKGPFEEYAMECFERDIAGAEVITADFVGYHRLHSEEV